MALGHTVRGLLLWRLCFPLFFVPSVILSYPLIVERSDLPSSLGLGLWLAFIFLFCLARILLVKKPTTALLLLLPGFGLMIVFGVYGLVVTIQEYDPASSYTFVFYSDSLLLALPVSLTWFVFSVLTLVPVWKLGPLITTLRAERFATGSYCPACLVAQEGKTCVTCGHDSAERGWCAACRAALLRPPGRVCPTHWTTLTSARTLSSIEVLRHIDGLHPAKLPTVGKYLDIGLSLIGSLLAVALGCGLILSFAEEDAGPARLIILGLLVLAFSLLLLARWLRR